MAKIYSPPVNIVKPVLNYKNLQGYHDEVKKYVERVSEFSRLNSDDTENRSYIGKVISMPVADGKARYVVHSLKPVQLIHLEDGDAYQHQMADLLTKKRVIEMIEADLAWEKLVEENRKKKESGSQDKVF